MNIDPLWRPINIDFLSDSSGRPYHHWARDGEPTLWEGRETLTFFLGVRESEQTLGLATGEPSAWEGRETLTFLWSGRPDHHWARDRRHGPGDPTTIELPSASQPLGGPTTIDFFEGSGKPYHQWPPPLTLTLTQWIHSYFDQEKKKKLSKSGLFWN